MEEKRELSIIKMEDVSTKDYDAIRITCFPGTSIKGATAAFVKIIFANENAVLYKYLRGHLKDEAVWECNDEFTDMFQIYGDARKVAIRHHYRFERNSKGQLVKANPERVVKYVKVCALGEYPDIDAEVQRYLAQVPEELFIDDEEKDD